MKITRSQYDDIIMVIDALADVDTHCELIPAGSSYLDRCDKWECTVCGRVIDAKRPRAHLPHEENCAVLIAWRLQDEM